ncbi:ovochymase-2 isoform X1 [Ictalurus punctatus]|uniref:Ovochymase-2 isoform X1 n=1 Tax=Ictalurus punctatus TaxID=7998 RepID=A0A2D0RK38_ICTPU|nr:ovochymase-2 isoform X1 [Ictalurus punctatus]
MLIFFPLNVECISLAGDFAQPVCLPLPGEIFPPKTTCIVAGWGRIKERGQMASVLHEVQLNLVDPAICEHILQTIRPGLQNLTVLCAGPERGGKDACQGDSGGPLLCPRADGQWVVVGITSWGKGCGRSWINNRMKPLTGRSSPAVFTNVPVFMKWLLRKGRIISQLSVQEGALKGSEGIIRYPVHPGQNYSNNEACSWSISVPGSKRILLEFLKFDLENHPLCQSDHLTVFAGEGLPIGRFCGSKSPAPALIHSNTTTLQFMSDFSVSGSGFSLRFRAVEDNYTLGPGCGTVALFQSPVAMQSPEYPRSYGDDTHCRWVIYVPEGYVVKLDFADFVLEESEGCQYDSLSVFRDFEAREQIVVLCGQSIPPPVLSFGRVMVVQFMTDSSVSARGFSANLSVISRKDLQNGEHEDLDEEENDDSGLLPL